MNIPVDNIELVEELYPRNGFDNDAVNRYRLAIDNLPPIEVTHESILIDGYHRLLAHRLEGKETIAATVEELSRDAILWEATKRNAGHGLQLSRTDKKRLARQFFTSGQTQTDIAGVLSISTGSVSNWVRDIKKEIDAERDAKILNMWLACCTQEEIAEEVELDQSSVSKILDSMKNLILEEIHTPDSLQTFNIWKFGKCDDQYGMTYPGRIPGQVVENTLYYYTEPFDTVVDPMAGGGTTLDVCKAMYRRHRCYDISPVRADISQHDIVADGFPKECKGASLVFLDPPYWKQKQGSYSDDKTNLANMPLDSFYDAMSTLFAAAYDTLGSKGHIAVIVGPTQSKGTVYDHAFEFAKMLEQRFAFIHRVIVPYTTQQAKPYHITDARDGHYMLKLYRDLLIFQKVA